MPLSGKHAHANTCDSPNASDDIKVNYSTIIINKKLIISTFIKARSILQILKWNFLSVKTGLNVLYGTSCYKIKFNKLIKLINNVLTPKWYLLWLLESSGMP